MEGEKDNCISFLDISITRDRTGELDANIYRNSTRSERYLNFKSEHPLKHKSAVVNALTHRANSLIRDENKKRMEYETHTKPFNFKRLSELAIKLEIKNQSQILYLLHPQLAMLSKHAVLRYFPMFQSFQKN